ncbi:MAG: 3,4-dihydroxy-2-butanone-4-phosphate synthase [Deltaproteobacteria bacterium]|nr:3,4-dihydroxy-2-butanone-4-phosphate synthase [Deltaproteobacteria bacterium]MDQ3297418.1 3,4-dihydroxy-2-butanone-4-phosphate synthase [Myxococcota bacterium]
MSPIERVTRALEEIRGGRMVILVDDEDRENEGDLVFAAELVTPENINFMATHARGLICLAMDDSLIDKLDLPMMVRDNQASLGTAFTVSIEARHGVSTGISARDRATTIRAAIADDARPENVVSPGHVFPLRARKGGVLVRTGQTEGSVDLARLAGLKPAGVICEIMRDDGEMARRPELEEFAAKHGLLLLSVADMIAYRLQRERIVRSKATGALRPGALGPGEPFTAHYYDTEVEDTEYLALVRGDVAAASAAGQPVLVRVAAMDPLGDPFMLRPDLVAALEAIDAAGTGVLLYVMNRGRMRLGPAFERLVLQRTVARDSVPRVNDSSETLRDFGLGAQVLADLGLKKIRLMIHSDRKIAAIEGFGIEVVERVPIPGRAGSRSRQAQ